MSIQNVSPKRSVGVQLSFSLDESSVKGSNHTVYTGAIFKKLFISIISMDDSNCFTAVLRGFSLNLQVYDCILKYFVGIVR